MQFFIRIYKEIPNCILASFSTLKYVNSSNFIGFREYFKAKFLKGFICPAYTFDNVSGKFPIGFLIWNTGIKNKIDKIQVEVFDLITRGFLQRSAEANPLRSTDNNTQGAEATLLLCKKNFYSGKNVKSINQWIKKYDNKNVEILGYMGNPAPDFQHNSQLYISLKKGIEHFNFWVFNVNNIIVGSIYLSVRQIIEDTWINDRDQFLYPNDKWEEDKNFQNDCLAFALFHGQNRISSSHGVNHWIPFSENEANSKKAFTSHFMKEFIDGKINRHCERERGNPNKVDSFAIARNDGNNKVARNDAKDNSHCEHAKAGMLPSEAIQKIDYFGQSPRNDNENLFESKNFIPTKPIEFSVEAKNVFNAGLELWKYYHKNCIEKSYNANASLYDIKEYFQGRNEKCKMNNKSKDEEYNKLIGNLRSSIGILAKKIEPKIYEYGFLRE